MYLSLEHFCQTFQSHQQLHKVEKEKKKMSRMGSSSALSNATDMLNRDGTVDDKDDDDGGAWRTSFLIEYHGEYDIQDVDPQCQQDTNTTVSVVKIQLFLNICMSVSICLKLSA